MTYADDLWFTACGPRAFEALAAALLILAALGVPLAWKKAKGGTQVDWVGYWLDIGRFHIGILASRQAWVLRRLSDKVKQGTVLVKEIQEGLGRLGLAAGPLEQLRPFLGPLYAGTSAAHPRAFFRPPLLVTRAMTLLLEAAKANRTIACAPRTRSFGE